VVDENGEPIIGANIIEVAPRMVRFTNVDGNFSLQVANDATIRITFIGYLEQNITPTDRTSFSIALTEDTQALDEIIVVGYGTMRKSDLTGAIVSANLEVFRESPEFKYNAIITGIRTRHSNWSNESDRSRAVD
jgi:hypothetical protein